MKKIFQFFRIVWFVYRQGTDVIFRDPLTRLYNRRFFEEIITYEIERARRFGPLSLVIFDIDEFKAINDNFGHLEGDRVLQKVAEIITNICRKSDRAFRWGGDEFLMLLPGTNTAGANELMQKTFKALSAEGIWISYGVGSSEEDFTSIENFISSVDDRMYQDKKGLKRVSA